MVIGECCCCCSDFPKSMSFDGNVFIMCLSIMGWEGDCCSGRCWLRCMYGVGSGDCGGNCDDGDYNGDDNANVIASGIDCCCYSVFNQQPYY